MSTIRGRAVRAGAMVSDPQGASARTEDSSGGQSLRPAYSFRSGVAMPNAGGAGGSHADFFDLSTVASWRLIFTLAAAAYIVGFHASLGRFRVGVPAA